MDSLFNKLKQQTEKQQMSVGDLPINKMFIVELFAPMETKFGPAIQATLYDDTTGGMIEVFLPKSVKLTQAEVDTYNGKEEKDLGFKFEGKLGRSFKIKFEKL